MSDSLTEREEKLVEEAKKRILNHARRRRRNGLNDILYAFVLSDKGNIYEGKPFESNQPSFNFCAERHAINEMQFREDESSEIEAVLIAGPVPDTDCKGTMPCGACRHAIREFGAEDTSIIVSSFVREEEDWEMFPRIQKFSASELYPEAYEPVKWD